MNAYWISQGRVFVGTFCTSQGVLKNMGNIGTALWFVQKRLPRNFQFYSLLYRSMVKQPNHSYIRLRTLIPLEQVIAIHTFCLLFLKWKSGNYTLYATLFVVWLFIGLVVITGPTAVQSLPTKGPYCEVLGFDAAIYFGHG